MTTFDDTFEKLASFNAAGLAPARQVAAAAADTFEKVARKNCDVFSDFMDFSIAQARLPAEALGPQEFFESQLAVTRAFAEQLSVRASEYAEFGSEFQAAASQADAEKPAAASRKKASKPRRKAA